MRMKWLVPLLLGAIPSLPLQAADLLDAKLMTLDLAREIANRTLDDCRKRGYRVSVVVVDRDGSPQVVLRDDYVARFATEIATRKAGTAILSGVSSGELRKTRSDIHSDLNEIPGVLLVQGGLPIRAGGSLIGAVGVSGAPGGDKDEACAATGIKAVQDRLEFAE